MKKKINVRRVIESRKKQELNIETMDGLVGFTLEDINDEGMVVSKNGKHYQLFFNTDGNDCCGYATISTKLLIDGKNNPVITKVEYLNSDDDEEGSYLHITFFGLDKAIAEVEATAYSGSGWCYGANATVHCKPLGLDETLACW